MKGVTLVLGPGGARAFSAVGALRVLGEIGVGAERVIGCSMGAVVGAAYCGGMSIDEIERRALRIRARHFLGWGWFSPGVMSDRGLRNVVESLVGVERFEQLEVPLTVVCTDLQRGEATGFDEGELIAPLVGSCTPAALIEPTEHAGRFLIDGGYACPYPAEFAEPGSKVIVIDPLVVPDWEVGVGKRRSLVNGLLPWRKWSQYIKSMDVLIYRFGSELAQRRPHLRIAPELEGIAFHDFGRMAEAIRRGRAAVEEKRAEIEAFLEAE